MKSAYFKNGIRQIRRKVFIDMTQKLFSPKTRLSLAYFCVVMFEQLRLFQFFRCRGLNSISYFRGFLFCFAVNNLNCFVYSRNTTITDEKSDYLNGMC